MQLFGLPFYDKKNGKEQMKKFIVNILMMGIVVLAIFPDTVWADGAKQVIENAETTGITWLGIDWDVYFTTRNIVIVGSAVIFLLAVLVGIVYKRTSRGSYDFKQYWFVVRELTGREIKRKYARSVLGVAWSVLNPLMYMGVMSLIFSTVFKSSIENFPVYYLIAYMFWTLFSTATNTAMTSFVDNKNLVQKTKLPREIFVLSRNYTALVNFGFSCVAFALMLLLFRIQIHVSALLFPVIVLFAFMFTTGVSFILSSIFVFHRDIKFIYKNLMPLLSHLIAMFYPIEILSGNVRLAVEWNPIYSFIRVGRDCMLMGQVSDINVMLQMIIWGIAVFLVGLLVFKLAENDIIQEL